SNRKSVPTFPELALAPRPAGGTRAGQGVLPCHLQRRLQFRLGQPVELYSGPALASPGIVNGPKSLRRQQHLELLFLGIKLQVRRPPVGGEGGVGASHPEGGAVEMRGFGRAVQRQCQTPQILRLGHDRPPELAAQKKKSRALALL